MKGYRTVAYEILSTFSVGLAVWAGIDFHMFGLDPTQTMLVGLGIKTADSMVGLWLRWMTDTPVGVSGPVA